MNVSKCPNCGMPMESSNLYAKGMTIKCRHCNQSGLPLNSGACIYDKIKREKPESDFDNAFDLQSLFSKMALVSFFVFIVSIGSLETRNFAVVSFIGFLLFSVFYGFLRFKNSE